MTAKLLFIFKNLFLFPSTRKLSLISNRVVLPSELTEQLIRGFTTILLMHKQLPRLLSFLFYCQVVLIMTYRLCIVCHQPLPAPPNLISHHFPTHSTPSHCPFSPSCQGVFARIDLRLHNAPLLLPPVQTNLFLTQSKHHPLREAFQDLSLTRGEFPLRYPLRKSCSKVELA